MKTLSLGLILLVCAVPFSAANINFKWVQPQCDYTAAGNKGCLRGQYCNENNTCSYGIPPINEKRHIHSTRFRRRYSLSRLYSRAPAYSLDGTCGPLNDDTICDPNSAVYDGGCCSQHGFCGNTDAYCGDGCISGCDGGGDSPPDDPSPVTTDGTCGPANGNTICGDWEDGSCCSQHGFCGSTDAYCGDGCISGCTGDGGSSSTDPDDPSPVTTDGTCGPNNGNTICGDWEDGSCCSQHGFCGSTDAYCGDGCISGCDGGGTSPEDPLPVTTDGTCGPDNGNTVCGDWANGGCCSALGWCGSSSAHCGEGCISGCDPTGEPVIGITTDGTCGATNGNTVCGDWEGGSCCSMFGFCGDTASHCGDGCQSGPCDEPPIPLPDIAPRVDNPILGSFEIVGSSGVPAMHAGLLPNGRVAFLDKIEDYTELELPNGQFAYSSEYDPETNQVVPLAYESNAFCSGGAFLADGTFLAIGGNAALDFVDPTIIDGLSGIRQLQRSSSDDSLDGTDWQENLGRLDTARWYPSAQTMPDGTIFVSSGSLNGLDPMVEENNNPTYEILNAQGSSITASIPMDILVNNQPYYMYPFMHLLRDGSLFVFTAKSCELFDVGSGTTILQLPDLPGDYRTYPNTGTSVMFPLQSSNNWEPEVLICGGGPYQDVNAPTDHTCGRISPLATNAEWELDAMYEGRCMVEGVLLPDGMVLFFNGVNQGAQGFNIAVNATQSVMIYDPAKPLGDRFTAGATSTVPRVYHSVALLLLDGTVMISGSNPVEMPVLEATAEIPYVTEFRVEIYTPPYLVGNENSRPTDVVLSETNLVADGSVFQIDFSIAKSATEAKIVLYHGGFVTHSVHMGQRMVYLDFEGWNDSATSQSLTVEMPPNNNVAPPGPYVVYVVVDGIPSIGQVVLVS